MNYQIKTLNSISPVYRGILREGEYRVGPNVENPDAIMVRSADMHSMTPQSRLLCVGRAGAGVNNIPLEPLAERGIVVFNSPGANANAVKELTCAGLLLASRKISDGIAWVQTLAGAEDVEKRVEKEKNRFIGPELSGKTLGVVGLGAIGVLVANMGTSLGMDVLGYDPFISVDHAWKLSRSVRHATELSDVLEKSDYITLHLPLMDSTRGMIDASVLARMKPGAALLNFSRAGLCSIPDVIDALNAGRLRTYVTDFPTSELVGVPGVVLTPHLGASTPESEDNCVRMVAGQIDDYLKNGSIVNSCNYPSCPLPSVRIPRVAVLHKNIPNMIGTITGLISAEGLNIENMVNQSRGSYAYTVCDVAAAPTDATIEKMRAVDGVYRVRLLLPGRD